MANEIPSEWKRQSSSVSREEIFRRYRHGYAQGIIESKLPSHIKKELLDKSRGELEKEKRELEIKLAPILAEHDALTAAVDAAQEIVDWDNEKSLVLGPLESSAFHKIGTSIANKRFCVAPKEHHGPEEFYNSVVKLGHIFLIQHDWATAFSNAKDFAEGEFRLPYEWCAFEFNLNGRRVIMICHESISDNAIFFQSKDHWIAVPNWVDLKSTQRGTIYSQIRAVCIALDAEVAVTNVIRAPHKLNHAREKRGELPILDHHVISLANRKRVTALGSSDHQHRSPRLHFRRGHWRHYESHKTWIKWTLVGNPDLGYIEKEYRL